MDGGRGFGIYIHWPFCLSKCPYCDFNSHVQSDVPLMRWRHALLSELGYYAEKTADRQVDSIFFGGGTPSLMPPELVGDLIAAVRTHWPVSDNLEITLEANPTSVEAARLAALRDAGVNRVSLGVQALDDADLHRLGRQHSAADAIAALETARGLFSRVSFDLIYARSGQSLDAWQQELELALALAGGHISLYQLTIEPGTAYFQAHRRGRLPLPDDDLQAEMYRYTLSRAAEDGFEAYEISNLAKPGAACRHNLIYWRYGHYAGIGPGAHGRLPGDSGRMAFSQHPRPNDWLLAVEANGNATETVAELDIDTVATEMLMMGLRLQEGVDLNAFAAETGTPFSNWCAAGAVDMLQDASLLTQSASHLSLTPDGRFLLNSVLEKLLP